MGEMESRTLLIRLKQGIAFMAEEKDIAKRETGKRRFLGYIDTLIERESKEEERNLSHEVEES